MLVAVATISQMVFMSKAVDRVFLGGEDLGGVQLLLLLLIGAIVLRSGLLWLREVVAQWGAGTIKSTLRERLFAHLMRLGAGTMQGRGTLAITYRLVHMERMVEVQNRMLATL